jgi:hypothetical protein
MLTTTDVALLFEVLIATLILWNLYFFLILR